MSEWKFFTNAFPEIHRECPSCDGIFDDEEWEDVTYLEGCYPSVIDTIKCPGCGEVVRGSDAHII